ncbi:fluoride efflux transporter FluC [Glycomyces tarimensis]
MTLLLIAVGAAIGAPARFLTDLIIAHYAGRHLPWGTLVVNVVGSGLAVFLTVTIADHELTALLTIGFCGTLTTYSTLSYETLRLIEDGRRHHALANVGANLGGGLAAGLAGFGIAHLLVL